MYLRIISYCMMVSLLLLGSCSSKQHADEKKGNTYYVSKSGSDENVGSSEKPFLTINKAAQVAMPGDVVLVREGVYREWVKPARGGSSEDKRITYQAETGADVRLLGSERTTNWRALEKGLWKAEFEGGLFHKNNAFRMLSRHPEEVGVDESGDGWGWLKYGRWTHRGDIIIDGKGLTEKQTLDEVKQMAYTWYVEPHETKTILYTNFGGEDPNEAQTELSLRPYAFYPVQPGLNYITIKGFTIMNVASHWAPPTVDQPGAVGSNGGHHWLIENNIIAYSKALGISIGLPTGEADSTDRGHHIIRNNVIMRCGQGAVAGQLWNQKTQVHNNFIEDINYRMEFGGWETAGIKFHNADSITIRNNFVRNVYTVDAEIGAAHGIWNDFKNSNWDVSQNVILNTGSFGILTEANFTGPNMVANNIIATNAVGAFSTRGDAWVNNLFVGSKLKWENQPWGNRVQIGNARWLQNIFMGGGLDNAIVEDSSIYRSNVFIDGAGNNTADAGMVVLDVASNAVISEADHQIILSFDLPEAFFNNTFPVVDHEAIALPFSFDASVTTDFFGNIRTDKNLAGPFINLSAGSNNIVVYNFPELYKKAQKLVR
ncbi:right-handed parallel beta-helix repeat-containing protein [Carboxylicivirga sp. RSCT41]|uniref:right-handed parallel beta-helix repeat-containing protein n=1 Tax=Carboxylicivirga agarovorans TaxID=3417570 RepID=UPI003D341041